MNKNIIDRILERVDKIEINGLLHWLWTGSISNEYPVIKYHGKTISVARLVLIHIKNEILNVDDQANHSRDCRIKRCINPDHLYKGTHEDNMMDEAVKCRICGGPKQPNKRCKKCKAEYNRKFYSQNNQHRANFGRA